jgi:Family of unknown function (DUF5318)
LAVRCARAVTHLAAGRAGGPDGGGVPSAYPDPVRTQRQVVDYALQRRALLADVHAGRVAVEEVCDAGPYLLRAARFHGDPTDQACPVCRKERLTLVSWVFGDALRHAAGTARRPDELERLAALHADFSVHVVEVCRTCRWNHLVLSYVLGTGGDPDTGRARDRRRTVAE